MGSHIIEMPKGFLAVRILQIIFAVIVLGLNAFLIANTIGFVFSATAFAVFCCIVTLIIITYGLVSEKAAKQAYNMWAILALDIVMVIFWLATMGALAALRAAFTVPVDIYLTKRYVYTWAGNVYLAILAAAAGVAAIELILFIISLIMFSARLHKHRKSGKTGAASTAEQGNVQPVNAEKIELQQGQGVQQPYAAPAPGYQPQYQQPGIPPAPMQPQHTGSTALSPVSAHPNGQMPYQPTMTPPPQQQYPSPTPSPAPQYGQPQPTQYAQLAPQYPPQAPPQGYHEAPAEYHGKP